MLTIRYCTFLSLFHSLSFSFLSSFLKLILFRLFLSSILSKQSLFFVCFFLTNVFLTSLTIILFFLFLILINYSFSPSFLSLSLSLPSFCLCSLEPTISFCKFIIHTVIRIKHKTQPTYRTRSFLSKIVFFLFLFFFLLLFFLSSRPFYLLTNQCDVSFLGHFPVGTDVSSFLYPFFHLIVNPQIQNINRDQKTRRNHPQVKLPTTKKKKFATFKQVEQASLLFIFLFRLNSARIISRGTAKHPTLLPYIHTKSQTQQQVNHRTVRLEIRLNRTKNSKVSNTLKIKILDFLFFPLSSIIPLFISSSFLILNLKHEQQNLD